MMIGHLWFFGIVNTLGETASSAHGIALGWEALSFLCGSAFGTAAMTLVGQNLGAGKPARAARSGWVAFALGGGLMCLMGAVFFTFAPEMFTFICPHAEQRAIVEAGVPVLRLEAFAEPALACIIIFLCALRGPAIPASRCCTTASVSLGYAFRWRTSLRGNCSLSAWKVIGRAAAACSEPGWPWSRTSSCAAASSSTVTRADGGKKYAYKAPGQVQ